MDKIYVFGHRNPDTDSVCGAIALANMYAKMGMNTEPRVLGVINEESLYVLNKFKVNVPTYLNDVKTQLKNVNYHKDYLINENRPIIDAFTIMNSNGITGLPLVDDNKIFKGYVSLKEIAADMIYNENLKVSTSFENLLYVLEATSSIMFDNFIEGYAHAATFDTDSFINNIDLDEQSILIVGNRESIIEHAINKRVKLIILVKGSKLSKELKDMAKKNRVNVIMTNKSSFKIARVLCLSNPIKSIQRNIKTITFNNNDYLTDFIDMTAKLKHTNYPILNNHNTCLGMLRTIDTHEVNKKKVILVDHNMVSQSVDGLNEAEILEIVDHHNIGDINTVTPISFRNMQVGSVCTIIYYLYKENSIKITKQIAGLLLSGIISDTLLLQSPTTTQRDKLVASDLAKIAKLNIKQYGKEMLASGVSIENKLAKEILFKDYKTYKIDDENIAIGQVFTTDYAVFKPREEELVAELNNQCANHGYRVAALFITNFLTNNSYILYSENAKHIIEVAYGIDDLYQGYELPGIVSRKKQMVPNIMDVVEHL